MNRLRSLSIILQDAEIDISDQELNHEDEEKLKNILFGCKDCLGKLERTIEKYSELDSRRNNIKDKVKRAWKQLSLEPEDIRELRSNINANITLLNAFTSRLTKNKIAKLVRCQEDKEKQTILDWLAPANYAAQQHDFFSKGESGTGQWLLESADFQQWVKTKNLTLFCTGIPGAGKTILTSIIIEYLSTRSPDDGSNVVAYIYCNYKQQHEQLLENLLASLLRQLAEGKPDLPHDIKLLHNRYKEKRSRPSVDEISAVLQSVATQYSRVFIVIDALDECHGNGNCKEKLLSEISILQAKCGINFFATSRSIPDTTQRFDQGLKIEIRAEKQDVEKYVNSHIRELPSVVRKNPQIQKEIISGIVNSIDGMYVACFDNLPRHC
jgi:Cdc6-like AAA superfamily ATPase